MNDQINKSQEKKRTVQDLGDPNVLYSLCFSCVEEQAGIMEQLISGKMDSRAAAQAHTDMAGKLAAILYGKLPEFFKPVENWNGDKLGQFLAQHFADEIAGMDEENRILFSSEPSAAIFYATLKLQREITAILSEEHEKDDDEVEASGRKIHELCAKWVALFSQKVTP